MKVKLLLVVIVFFVILICNNAKAYNLNDAVITVLQNNEEIQGAKKKLETEILKKPKVATEFLPNIALELNQTFHDNRNFNDSSKPIKYHQGSLILRIEQEIYSGGSTIAKIAAVDAEINVAYQEYTKMLNGVVYKTIQAYQNVLTARESVKVQIQNTAMAEKNVKKAKVAVKLGADTKTSLYLAEASFSEVKSRLEDYKVQQVQAEAYFKYYVGEEAPEKMEGINLKKYKEVPTLKDFKALVSQKNPDIIEVKNRLKASKQGINIATSELMPKVSLFGQILKQDGPIYKGVGRGLSQIRNDGDTYGIRMTIPVFSRGLGYINISEARKEEKMFEHNLRNTVYAIQAETTSTWNNYISSDNIYNLLRKAEENYYKTYLSIQTEFDVGAKTISEVIKRQQDYNHSTIVRLQKEQESKLALFKIYKLIGNLPQVIKNSASVVK